ISANPAFRLHSLRGRPHYTEVTEEVWKLIYPPKAKFAEDDRIFVISFHSQVLRLRDRLENYSHIRLNISFLHWTNIVKAGTSVKQNTRPSWPENLIKLDEAISALKTVLERKGAIDSSSAIRQADLRPYLSQVDARLSTSGPLGSLPGIIKLWIFC